MRLILPFALCVAFATPAFAQTKTQAKPAPSQPVVLGAPAAAPDDVKSVEAITAALYDVISGPVGKARDWNRMRSLFIPGGRLMPVGARKTGEVAMRLLEVNDYIAVSGNLLVDNGFSERELASRVERFGHIAHVFSTYEGAMEKDPEPMRGINSIQLMNDGTRWWIVSVMWEDEHSGLSLPAPTCRLPSRRRRVNTGITHR